MYSARGRFLPSPCPDTFSYQIDPRTNAVYGLIEVKNLQMGKVAKLIVDLSIAMHLPKTNVGSIALVKSRESTFNDIIQGLPIQYRVNFPVQHILPAVVSISLNGQTICSGYRTSQGRVITTINLEHTLYSQLQSQKLSQVAGEFLYPDLVADGGVEMDLSMPSKFAPIQTRFDGPKTLLRPPLFATFKPSRPGLVSPVRSTASPPTSNYACGKPSSSFAQRLTINGELVDKGQFPWNVPLFDRDHPHSPKFVCGSTIITRRHLITAAHCVFDIDDFIRPERILAIPGMYNIDNFFEENAKLADVEAIIAHDEYVPDDDLNDADVAVLRLVDPLEYSDYIIPICPWQGENDLNKIVGQEGYVAGWGLVDTGSTSVPTYIRTTIVDRRQCNLNLLRMYPRNARLFCADGRGSAPCNGDSGSGLVLKRGNQYFLRGVVSKGLIDPNTLKCDASKFAIYTDIALFRFWLKKVTR
ncbi:chymotrypsin-like protease CTRL-1 isoform X2 [Uranotaenia lowii]|uniref:chymotrypsin-like protease CTRL-1 isoform X2 n=1 Tax=Uranotaenia lowii TaxID=190385 RepID=UPI002478A136|nr:chymotrypsin-like protease CTRL-1 isoform X2 [Uranotaenia lowii]